MTPIDGCSSHRARRELNERPITIETIECECDWKYLGYTIEFIPEDRSRDRLYLIRKDNDIIVVEDEGDHWCKYIKHVVVPRMY